MTNQRLLITDLDNTLYDWVSFFSPAFRGMVEELVEILETSEDVLLEEFKVVHQRYGNSEQPFAVLELPSLRRRFPGASNDTLLEKIDPALHRFNSIRKRALVLYEGVAEVLAELRSEGVKVVGHTEAILDNAYWRLQSLDIVKHFNRLYVLEGRQIHALKTPRWAEPPADLVSVVPRVERKPNPRLLTDICNREGVDVSQAYYVGDSLVRDVAMAKHAGVTAIWARYGTQYAAEFWTYLVKVTHWTDEDVVREKDLKARFGEIVPDFAIESFAELRAIVRA